MVTNEDLNNLMHYIEDDTIHNYNIALYNCTNFAIDSWNIMWTSNRSMVDYEPLVFGLPSNLVSELKNKEDVISQFNDYMYSWWYDMKPVLKFDGNGNLLDDSVLAN